VNAHGGHAELLSLPAIGVRGNTHFAFSDLNNVKIADLLSEYLHKERLDLPMKGQTPRHTHLVRPGWRGGGIRASTTGRSCAHDTAGAAIAGMGFASDSFVNPDIKIASHVTHSDAGVPRG
jgi:hypothetical protein